MGPHPDDCPACGTRAGQETPEHCSRCGLGLAGPQAAELRSINAELGRLDGARDRLSARRALLITGIRPHQRRPAPSPAAMTPAPATAPGRAAPPAVYSAKRARPELSRRAAANLLLAAGALLVGIAAVVFTVVNWSGIGTGGRAAILLAVSALAASAPWPLARRGLTATAESAAAIGLALTALDAYMAYRLVLPGAPRAATAGYASAACALLAAGWAVYGRVLASTGLASTGLASTGLASTGAPPRGPRLAAIGLAQLPLPLLAAAVAPTRLAVALALVATAGADLIIVGWADHNQAYPERAIAAVSAAATWLAGVALTLSMVLPVPAPPVSLRLSAVLAIAAIIGFLGAALRSLPTGGNESGDRRPQGVHNPRIDIVGERLREEAGEAQKRVQWRRSGDRRPQGVHDPRIDIVGEGRREGAGRAGTRVQWRRSGQVRVDWEIVTVGRWEAGVLAAVSGALIAVGLALPVAAWLPGQWRVAAFAAGGAVAAAAALWGVPRLVGRYGGAGADGAAGRGSAGAAAHRPGVSRAGVSWGAAGAATVLGIAGLAVSPDALAALLFPLSWAGRAWAGAPSSARAALAPGVAWHGSPATPVVLALVSAACWLAPRPARRHGPASRSQPDPKPMKGTFTVPEPDKGTFTRRGLPGREPSVPVKGTLSGAQPAEGHLHLAGAAQGHLHMPDACRRSPARSDEGHLHSPGAAQGHLHMPDACRRSPARSDEGPIHGPAVGIAVAVLACVSLPVAADMPYRIAIAALAVLAVALLAAGAALTERVLAGTAVVAGVTVGATAVAWSLTSPAVTIGVLLALLVGWAAAAAVARLVLPAVVATAGAVTAAAGLACAAALAAGWPARYAGFAVLGVAVCVIGAATLIRRKRPVPSLVLDIGAAPVTMLAAGMAAQRADTFSVLALAAALLASSAAWRRGGRGRQIALGGSCLAAVASFVPQASHYSLAAFGPYVQIAHPWRGISVERVSAAGWSGPPLVLVVVAGAAAMTAAVAAGAWRERDAQRGVLGGRPRRQAQRGVLGGCPPRQAQRGVLGGRPPRQAQRGVLGGRPPRQYSLDAVAAALPVVAAPAEGALGLSYGITVGFLLTLTLALTGWAAASRRVAATGAALATASLTLAWAIAAPLPTLVVLGCLSAGFAACAWRARLAAVRAGGAAASVLSASAFAGCSVLAAGPSASLAAWLPGLAVLGAAGAAQLAAAAVVRSRPLVSLAVEISGWLAALAGAASTFGSPGAASIGLAVAGVLCLGVAARPDRRPLLWAGLAQLEAALCVRLAEAGVHAPEPYAVPASAIAIAAGWYCSRRWPQAASLATYGPGLALLLLPGLVAAGQGSGLGPAAGARPCGGRGDAGGRPGTAGCAVAARGWGGGPGRRA